MSFKDSLTGRKAMLIVLLLILSIAGAKFLSLAYTDFAVKSVSPNPVYLDSGGKATFTMSGFTRYSGTYDFVITRNGVTEKSFSKTMGTTDQVSWTQAVEFVPTQGLGGYTIVMTKRDNPDGPQKASLSFNIVAATQAKGVLKINSDPTGARVYFNGVFKGYTPMEIADLNQGTYTIQLDKSGYESLKCYPYVDQGQVTVVQKTLVPAGSVPNYNPNTYGDSDTSSTSTSTSTTTTQTGMLSVTSSPGGANVLIDGVSAGATPVFKSGVTVGNHVIKYEMSGYTSEQLTRSVTANQVTFVDISLNKIPTASTTSTTSGKGTLSITSFPTGATVYVDGNYVGVTPCLKQDLDPGYHAVRYEAAGYNTETVSKAVFAQQTTQSDITMTKSNTAGLGGSGISTNNLQSIAMAMGAVMLVLGGVYVIVLKK